MQRSGADVKRGTLGWVVYHWMGAVFLGDPGAYMVTIEVTGPPLYLSGEG